MVERTETPPLPRRRLRTLRVCSPKVWGAIWLLWGRLPGVSLSDETAQKRVSSSTQRRLRVRTGARGPGASRESSEETALRLGASKHDYSAAD